MSMLDEGRSPYLGLTMGMFGRSHRCRTDNACSVCSHVLYNKAVFEFVKMRYQSHYCLQVWKGMVWAQKRRVRP